MACSLSGSCCSNEGCAHGSAIRGDPFVLPLILVQMALHSVTLSFPGLLYYACFNFAQWDSLIRLLRSGELGLIVSSVTRGTCVQAWQPEFNPQDPHMVEGENQFFPISPLIFTYGSTSHTYTHTYTLTFKHTRTHAQTYTHSK